MLSVTQINDYIKKIIENDKLMYDVWIKGEISNFKPHYSGHLYLTLKDEGGVIKAVMFKSAAKTLKFAPKDGMKVLARGRITVYSPSGQYQINLTEMRTDGLGDLHVAFEQLKEKLKDEGLFRQELKKSIPRYPATIGLVTSPTGAAIRDMLNVLGRRFKYSSVYIYPVLVQGEQAAMQIAEGIQYFNNQKEVDVIITGRGGGSIEELWAFNEEIVARAIFASRVPVISAVGHETDITISDFVADLRAPTPSAAAELAVPSADELKQRIDAAGDKLISLLLQNVGNKRLAIERLSINKVFDSFENSIAQMRVKVDNYSIDLGRTLQNLVKSKKEKMKIAAASLNALSPLGVLTRGYSVALDEKGGIIKSIDQLKKGDGFRLKLSDGSIKAKVEERV